MYLKKCLALLVSAALAVSLLASCGSRALSNVMADLLTGLYDNVSVEVDNDLTAALKKAVSAGGTQEEILAALVENLNLSGVSIAFSSLGSGQQGQHGVTLTFQTGTDPDAAARIALAQWASVFGSLPKNGSYSASVAMIEADNGYYIAVDVEVTRAGSSSKDEPDLGYTVSEDGTTYEVYNAEGLLAWNTAVQGNLSLNCTLTDDIDLTGKDWTPIGYYDGPSDDNSYTGTFDGNHKTITGLTVNQEGTNYVGLIGYLYYGGKVQNLTLENVNITGTGSDYVGGVVGLNYGGTVTACTVSGNVKGTGESVGGVVGFNNIDSTVTACYSTGSVSGSYLVGGVVGENWGTITACYSTGSVSGGTYVGGVVGFNSTNSSVTACYHATGSVSGSFAGGVVGYSDGRVTACYWSDYDGNGIGGGSGEAKKVTDDEWEQAKNAMNTAIQTWNTANPNKQCDREYELGDEGLPVLTQ